MPITAKLSRRFYERLGDEVTNELVDWLNAVDQSYRQEFKDLFDANFGQVRAELRGVREELSARFAAQERSIDARFDTADARAEALEARLTARIEGRAMYLLKWIFAIWVASMGTLAALLKL